MQARHAIVNGLVIIFALFFTYVGVSFLLMPVLGDDRGTEGEPSWQKALLGAIFILAAAPMYYYVFGKSAKAMPPPPPRKRPGSGEGGSGPSDGTPREG